MNVMKYIVVLALGALMPSVSYAYVDPGSGSVIVTAILGFAAAISYTCRKYFYQIKRAFVGRKNEDGEKSLDENVEKR